MEVNLRKKKEPQKSRKEEPPKSLGLNDLWRKNKKALSHNNCTIQGFMAPKLDRFLRDK